MVTEPSAVRALVLELAHLALVKPPAFISAIWRETARGHGFEQDIKAALRSCKPTVKGVLRVSITDAELDQPSKDHHGWLVKFVKDADEETLRNFLRYATGADVICVQEIKVLFNKLFGLNQRVVARTCGCLLEVPCRPHIPSIVCPKF